MQGIIPIIATIAMLAFYGLLLQNPQPYVTIASNREVSFTVPEKTDTQYIYAYIKNGNMDKSIYCYFQSVPNYNGKCSRAHEPQFQYFVEYQDSSGKVLSKVGPLQIVLQPTATIVPTRTPIPTATPKGRAILPIIVR